MIKHEWGRIEAGWYTHPKHGGVCKERDGWYWYPACDKDRSGPRKTLKAAIQEAENER